VIKQLSVSQVERFDHEQKGGCELAWWFERVHGLKPDDQSAGQSAGDSGHELFAHYFRHGTLPEGRKAMKKAVSYAIQKGDLPAPGPDMLIEWRGDGQEKFSPYTCDCRHPNSAHVNGGKGKCTEAGCKCEEQKPLWLPVDRARTFWLGGVPWDLFIDLAFRRGDVPTVLDHKFSSDLEQYAKRDDEMVRTVQLPVYALALMHAETTHSNHGFKWSDAKVWRLGHNYNARTAGTQFIRSALVSKDEILERREQIEGVVKRMHVIAKAPRQQDVPFNRKACHTWMGCPHQSICSAFKENKVALTKEEEDLFGPLGMGDGTPSTPPADNTASSSPAAEEDEETKAKREFEERMAKIKADKEAKAKLEAEAKAKAEAERLAKEAAAKAAATSTPGAGSKVLPDDAPPSNPALAAEQPEVKPEGKGKGGKKSTPAAPAALSLADGVITISINLEQLKALLAK
jgi:hypothetical protein